METSVVTQKGQMVVPARIRRKLKIKRGTKLVIFERFAGILPAKGKASKVLLEERRMERERENGRAR